MPNPLQTLSELLRGTGAQPVVSPDRSSSSTIYDLQYRLMVNACAFALNAKSDPNNMRRLQAAKLKLLQFVAIRPWLLPVVREWSASESESQRSLLISQHLRRGFLGDEMHDSVIDFLVARDVLIRTSTHLLSGKNAHIIAELHSTAVEQDLFTSERAVLQALNTMKITNMMLEGQ